MTVSPLGTWVFPVPADLRGAYHEMVLLFPSNVWRPDARFQFRLLLVLFPVFSLLSAWRLWWLGPCPVSLVAVEPELQSVLMRTGYLALLAGLLWVLVSSRMMAGLLVLGGLGLATLMNVHVLSPYIYEQVAAVLVFLFLGGRGLVGVLGVMYALAGFTKLNPHYPASLEFLLRGLEPLTPLLLLGGMLVPFVEMGVALALWWGGRYRRWAGVLMAGLHISILLLLLHSGWAWTVWPWNIQMAGLGLYLARNHLTPERGRLSVPSVGLLLSVPFFLGAVSSVSPWGALSIPLAFPLYANLTLNAEVVDLQGKREGIMTWFIQHSGQEVLRSRGALERTGACLVKRGLVRHFELLESR